MIELIPAIDVIEGRCVRLTKGDYDSKKVYEGTPAEVAQRYESLGFNRLHVVDLDGAKSHHIVNLSTLQSIHESTRLRVDFGGGIKSREDVEKAFAHGADLVTIGSLAVTDPTLCQTWIKHFGAERIILGADARHGKISINGWKEDSNLNLLDFIQRYYDLGLRNVLCTEISHDGTLQGPAIELYRQIMQRFPDLHLIASGGVGCIQDILDLDAAGIPAVVFGKAIYEGKIDLAELLERCPQK